MLNHVTIHGASATGKKHQIMEMLRTVYSRPLLRELVEEALRKSKAEPSTLANSEDIANMWPAELIYTFMPGQIDTLLVLPLFPTSRNLNSPLIPRQIRSTRPKSGTDDLSFPEESSAGVDWNTAGGQGWASPASRHGSSSNNSGDGSVGEEIDPMEIGSDWISVRSRFPGKFQVCGGENVPLSDAPSYGSGTSLFLRTASSATAEPLARRPLFQFLRHRLTILFQNAKCIECRPAFRRGFPFHSASKYITSIIV